VPRGARIALTIHFLPSNDLLVFDFTIRNMAKRTENGGDLCSNVVKRNRSLWFADRAVGKMLGRVDGDERFEHRRICGSKTAR
jgi:hypothetical protein